MTKLTIASLSLFGSLAAGAGISKVSAQQTHMGTAPAVTLPNTGMQILHSQVNGREYLLQVALPSSYVTAQPNDTTRYPTLYLLDGQLDFPLLYSAMTFASLVRPTTLILVGIAAADSPFLTGMVDHTPQLTPADSAYFAKAALRLPPGGGAPQFLRVLKEEVIPLIDGSYRTSGDRGLVGSSLGGLFVAYAMLEEPDLFTRYAMISPSLWYPWGRDKGIILAREPEFAKQHPTFPKTVFVSVGSEETPAMASVAQQFLNEICHSLSEGYYKGLDLASEIVAGEGHASIAARLHVLNILYPADTAGIKPRRGVMKECR